MPQYIVEIIYIIFFLLYIILFIIFLLFYTLGTYSLLMKAMTYNVIIALSLAYA